jgi:hypothetical protein
MTLDDICSLSALRLVETLLRSRGSFKLPQQKDLETLCYRIEPSSMPFSMPMRCDAVSPVTKRAEQDKP